MSLTNQTSNSRCLFCRSNNTQPAAPYQHIEPGDWSLDECLDCEILFLHSMPNSKDLSKYYGEDYYGTGERKFIKFAELMYTLVQYLRAKSVHRFIPARGRVLDVGCGNGMMLKFLKQWGYQVDGIELDTVAAMRARKNLGQEIFMSFDELPFKNYQAICFWHSLEHMLQPREAIKSADQLLITGGAMIIAAPHINSLQSRLSGQSWLHLDLPRHLVHFNMNRLSLSMNDWGYQPIKIQHFSQEYNVIDSLCYLYYKLGFGTTYPFDLIRNIHRPRTFSHVQIFRTFIGLAVFPPLLIIAFLMANFFSLLGSGSTVTLYLRKRT